MQTPNPNNKVIVKNTIMLYIRMIFLMVITLYISRIVLRVLGVVDYGIYNVVAGFVNLFGIITGSITVAISRFITYELGKEKSNVNAVFSTSINVQIIIIVLIVLLAESIGLWFVNSKLVIPADRLVSANYLYHFTIISFCISLFSVPYNAAIIAYEKISAFAYIGIMDAILKLLSAYLINMAPYDKLATYGCFLFVVSMIVQIIYYIYCKKKLEGCTYNLSVDRNLLKKMLSYSGWTYIGASGAILRDQGGNILINIFFGPVLNATRGISMQVQSAVTSFSENFMTALKPQIIKSYASGNIDRMQSLISKGSRYSFYLLFILSLPIFLNTEYILRLWLHDIPEQSVLFVRLSILFALSESISSPLVTGASASGNIRNYQLIVGGLQILNFPIVYMLYKIGYPVHTVFLVAIFISQICLFARLFVLKNLINLSVSSFLKETYSRVILVLFVCTVYSYVLFNYTKVEFSSFIIISTLCILGTAIITYIFGLNHSEKEMVKIKLFQYLKK